MAKRKEKSSEKLISESKTNLFKSVFKAIGEAYVNEVSKAENSTGITYYDIAYVYYKTCDMLYRFNNELSDELEHTEMNSLRYKVYLNLNAREIRINIFNDKKEYINCTFDYTFMYFPNDEDLISMINTYIENHLDEVKWSMNSNEKLVSEYHWKPCRFILDSIDKFRYTLKRIFDKVIKGV